MRSLILLFPITAIFLIDPNDSAAQQNKQDTASTLTPTQTPPPAAAKGGFSTNWGKWGFPLFPPEFKATPGLSLFFHQTKKDVFQYGLVAVGLPADKTYRLWQKKLDASQPTRFPPELGIKIVSDNTGYVISRADGNVFLIATATFLKGEALQIALTSEDKTIVAFAKTIPNPIESIRGPYRTWVELGSAGGDGFIIWGEGFEPNEEIAATSISEGEIRRSKVQADSEGRFMTLMFPAVVGKQSGLATYNVVGKSGEVKVSYQWGPPALRLGP